MCLFTCSSAVTVPHHSLVASLYWCLFLSPVPSNPTLFWALTQAPLPVSEKFMSCDSWVMGSPLKNTKGIFSASKKFNKQSKIKNKEPQPKRHC